MDSASNRSASDSESNQVKSKSTTSARIFPRCKRKREDEYQTDLCSFKDEIKSMMLEQEKELKKVLREIQQSNCSIQSSIEHLIAQNEEFKKKIESLEQQRKEDRKYIAVLEDRIEDMQITTRKANFEIKNVPRKDTETKDDLMEMVMCLSKSVSSSVTRTDIKDIYRVRPKKEGSKNTPIVVETSSTLLKTNILKCSKTFNIQHKKKLRALHLGLKTGEDTPIYVSEQLTSKSSRLYFLARDLTRSKKYKFCWTAYGKVYVRREENSAIIAIRSEAQVQQLLNAS
ncbi:jg12306 [Pararge aegeria aegeria]|uniref:Jg12306 protein n=1 Tax=Pararge aegeria aegeria TaxID=348720 RepID=A0A8S4QF94_9NEOP|nr:jg12306 [Pararge aegeria aegeria]